MELLFQGWSKYFEIFGPGEHYLGGSIFNVTHVSFKCVTEYNRDMYMYSGLHCLWMGEDSDELDRVTVESDHSTVFECGSQCTSPPPPQSLCVDGVPTST